jgi:branched-chain amino acid transport system ATP-binding protein
MGLAPLIIRNIAQTIRDLCNHGATIPTVKQMTSVALQLADRGYVLENGVVKLSGSGAELARNPEVRKAYLGG